MQVTALDELLRGWEATSLPLYEALGNAIEQLVARGELPPGTRLPAERRLARQLNVSRGTVVRAYEQLRERGRVHTRHGSGTIVGPAEVPPLGSRESRVEAALPRDGIFRGFFELEDDAIDLRGAYWVGTDDLPRDALQVDPDSYATLLSGHGYHPIGLPALRETLAEHLTDQLDLPTTADQLLITSGGQQAIALIAELVLGSGDVVLAEELTYPGAMDAFHAAEARVVGIPMTEYGVDPTPLRREVQRLAPRLAYLMPSMHNPTGRVLPSAARQLVIEALAPTATLLVDDITLAESWFDTPPPAPLATLAGDDPSVLTVGSLSKSLWGGLRIGFVRASGPVLGRLGRLKVVADLGTPALSQAIAAELLRHGDTIAEQRRQELRRRYDTLAEGLRRHLPEWTFEEPSGGLCVWAHLGGASSIDFAPVAARHGVGVTPGTASSVSGRHRSELRLPFGHPPEVLNEAVERLARAWDEYRETRAPRLETLGVVV